MPNLWIMPCHIDPLNPIVYRSVNSIIRFHPGDSIIVCDSNTPNQQEIKHLEKYYQFEYPQVKILAGDTCFTWGALLRALENTEHKNFDKVCLIQDSMILNSNMDEFLSRSETSTPCWFYSFLGWGPGHGGYGFADEAQKNWAVQTMRDKIGLEWPDEVFHGTLGGTFFVTPEVITKMIEIGMGNIKVTCKSDDQAMERIVGYVIHNILGYKFYENSVFGNFFQTNFHNDLMTKNFFGRE